MNAAGIDVLAAAAPTSIADVQTALRELVALAADRRAAQGAGATRTWAVLGTFDVPDEADGRPPSENERVVLHDRVGRLAVRLAVDKTLCVGHDRAIRALHQGAVMEGSWGDEVRLVGSLDEARTLLRSDADWRPGPGDVVLLAGSVPGEGSPTDLTDELKGTDD